MFYGRDRGEDGQEAQTVDLAAIDDPSSWIEYCYVFGKDGKWRYFESGGLKEGLKNLQEGLEKEYARLGFPRPKGYYGFSSRSSAMITGRANNRRCRSAKGESRMPWLYAYFALQSLTFLLCLFVRTKIQLGWAGTPGTEKEGERIVLSSGKKAKVLFGEDCAKVVDCYRFDRRERFEICSYIRGSLESGQKRTERSLHSLEAELSAHAYAYRFRIEPERSRDADLDFEEDERWYVRMATSFFEVAGL